MRHPLLTTLTPALIALATLSGCTDPFGMRERELRKLLPACFEYQSEGDDAGEGPERSYDGETWSYVKWSKRSPQIAITNEAAVITLESTHVSVKGAASEADARSRWQAGPRETQSDRTTIRLERVNDRWRNGLAQIDAKSRGLDGRDWTHQWEFTGTQMDTGPDPLLPQVCVLRADGKPRVIER